MDKRNKLHGWSSWLISICNKGKRWDRWQWNGKKTTQRGTLLTSSRSILGKADNVTSEGHSSSTYSPLLKENIFASVSCLPCLCNTLAARHVCINIRWTYTGGLVICLESVHISWPEGISLLHSVQGSTGQTWHITGQKKKNVPLSQHMHIY